MAAETVAAVALSIAAGVLADWFFYLELPTPVRAWLTLAPFALSILMFLVFPLFRWIRQGTPIGGIALFAVIGLLPIFVGDAVLMNMVGCHFGECINL